jgi:hypothetical protein
MFVRLPLPHLNKELSVMVHTCHPSYAGSISRKKSRQNHKTLLKKKKKKTKAKGLRAWLK